MVISRVLDFLLTFNMGNFDSINESAENSRVKLLQIRVLLHGSNKLLDIGFLPLLLLQVFA